MRFDRPIGILLLLWPTLWGLWMAGQGSPSARNLLVFVVGVVLMRAAGCVANDLADRDFDPHVERTRDRPLAAGEVSVKGALVLLGVLLAVAFCLVLLTNRLTVMLAFAGAAFAVSYPFFKRFTHFPQVVLGVAFGWSIPMAFAAETGSVPAAAWWLFAINIVYAVIYDTLYAMVDRDDDLSIGVKSTAIFFGRHDVTVLAVLMLLMVVGLAAFGWIYRLDWPWTLGLVAVAVLFLRQLRMARSRRRDACFAAFKDNNWVGMAIFIGLAGHYALP